MIPTPTGFVSPAIIFDFELTLALAWLTVLLPIFALFADFGLKCFCHLLYFGRLAWLLRRLITQRESQFIVMSVAARFSRACAQAVTPSHAMKDISYYLFTFPACLFAAMMIFITQRLDFSLGSFQHTQCRPHMLRHRPGDAPHIILARFSLGVFSRSVLRSHGAQRTRYH